MDQQAIAVLAAGQAPAKLDLAELPHKILAFDNDEAGRRTLGALLARYGGRVSDCSGIYDGGKGLIEHLQRVLAERQAQSENEKKNKSIRL